MKCLIYCYINFLINYYLLWICSDDVYLSGNSFVLPVSRGAFYRELYIQAVSPLVRQVERRDPPFFRREREEEDVDRFIMYLVVCIFRCCGLWLGNEENLSSPPPAAISLSLSSYSSVPIRFFVPSFVFFFCSQTLLVFSVTTSGQFSPLEDIFRHGPLLSCYLLRKQTKNGETRK